MFSGVDQRKDALNDSGDIEDKPTKKSKSKCNLGFFYINLFKC